MPRYAVNIEGGGGKVLLMPSGHDTLNKSESIDEKISESFAMITTWDGKTIYRYESLGRAQKKEYEKAVEIMDRFIGRKGVFLPKIIIVDKAGNHLETTNRTKLPVMEKIKKAELLDYSIYKDDMPLTNPADMEAELETAFAKSKYFKRS
ncbi:hypothetical protein SDC9_155811 [bioreactor metagenome]|uniref:Uncharacterized protein n=1 Tax=bioreactor metagenome TaxID=1076179 RepID=A0A645F2I5_9ZZZZ